MNLALPALVLLFFVLPGFIARRSYLEVPLSDTKFSTEIAWAVIPASFLHLAGIAFCQWLTPYRVDFTTIGFLLAGTHDDAAEAKAFLDLSQYLWPIVLYNAALLPAAAAFIGWLFRKLVLKARLDLKFKALRPFDDWVYLIRGRSQQQHAQDFEWTWLDVMVKTGVGTAIYSGIMQSFVYSSDGIIEAVVFESAQKWMSPGALAPVLIPGTAFAVRFTEILNLNVSHYKLE